MLLKFGEHFLAEEVEGVVIGVFTRKRGIGGSDLRVRRGIEGVIAFEMAPVMLRRYGKDVIIGLFGVAFGFGGEVTYFLDTARSACLIVNDAN